MLTVIFNAGDGAKRDGADAERLSWSFTRVSRSGLAGSLWQGPATRDHSAPSAATGFPHMAGQLPIAACGVCGTAR